MKRTLSNISTYYTTSPPSVIEKLEKIQRNFLWNVTDGKVSFGAEGDCHISKKWGGFGIKDLKVFNKTLLGK